MELQVQVTSSFDFDFNNGRASSFLSTPSTPKRFGTSSFLSTPSTPQRFGEEFYFSAPTSPARGSTIYQEFEGFSTGDNYERGEASTSASPFVWEEALWSTESSKLTEDFAFARINGSASPQSDAKLYRGGKLVPSKPPPYGAVGEAEFARSPLLSPETPNSKKSRHKKSFWSTFSPKRKKENNPFETAFQNRDTRTDQERGRERVLAVSASRSGRRAARSISPPRVSKYPWEEEEKQLQNSKQSTSTKPPSYPLSLSTSSKGSRKWRLKDLLLFRSASEGRATDKDPFTKYAHLYRKHQVAKSSGSKSTESSSTVPAPRRGSASPHELHYTVNKAIAQDMKKKSFLPYKQGILGRLAINPTVHALAHGFGSLAHS